MAVGVNMFYEATLSSSKPSAISYGTDSDIRGNSFTVLVLKFASSTDLVFVQTKYIYM